MSDSLLCIPRNETVISKQNYNVLSPSSYTHICICERLIFVQDRSAYSAAGTYCTVYICGLILEIYIYINRSQTHECGNWNWGSAIPRKEIHKWYFPCSVGKGWGGDLGQRLSKYKSEAGPEDRERERARGGINRGASAQDWRMPRGHLTVNQQGGLCSRLEDAQGSPQGESPLNKGGSSSKDWSGEFTEESFQNWRCPHCPGVTSRWVTGGASSKDWRIPRGYLRVSPERASFQDCQCRMPRGSPQNESPRGASAQDWGCPGVSSGLNQLRGVTRYGRILRGHFRVESKGGFWSRVKVAQGSLQCWIMRGSLLKSGGSSGIPHCLNHQEGSGLEDSQAWIDSRDLIKTGGCSEDTSLCNCCLF